MSYDTIDEWIREENGHQPSRPDQLITAYWFYRNDITVSDDDDRRTSQVREKLQDRLDHEVAQVLDNLAEIGVLDKREPPTRVFIQNERTRDAFFTPNDEGFPPNLFEEISRLVYDLHLREGEGERGRFPGQLRLPTIAPVADGGESGTTMESEDTYPFRQFIADELEVDPLDVEEALVEPDDPVECMVQFDDLVEAIKESDDVERELEYDQVGWRNRANRWTLSETAKRIEENESLPT